MDEKKHFKMYKSNKGWLIAAITTATIAMGGISGVVFDNPLNTVVAHADTNSNVSSWMPDTNLQKSVLTELRSEGIISSSAQTFNQADLSKMNNLSINYNQPNNLDGLQYATNLTSLSIANNGANNGISNLAPLANLTNLRKLVLNNNQITDLSPLAKLTSLTELQLNSNNISDTQPLSDLTNLTHLELGYNKLSDNDTLSFKSLTNLSYLKISGNDSITNLDNLNNLHLSKFYASDLPNLTNISGLKNSTNLSSVEMVRDNIDDISVFKGFTKLNAVDLDNNHISDLSPLNGSFNGDIVSTGTGFDSTNLSVENQTVTLNSVPIDYNGQKVTVSNGTWSVNNDSRIYLFSGTTNLPDTNKQSISASDYTTYVGADKPTAADFKASATDKDGNVSSITNVDLSKADLNKAGVYDVTITSADGQSKTVKLTVKDNKQSISASDYTTYVGADKPTAADFKASATDKDGNASSITNVDLSKADLNKAGVYDVTITSADGQSKTVKLTVKSVPSPQPGKKGTVTIHYVDQGGNKIAPDDVQSGEVGDNYTTNKKSIGGYTFSKVNGNSTGTYTDGNTNVTYVYSKDSNPIPVKKGQAVYAIKKIGLYSNKSFSKNSRKVWYNKQKRTERPMFVVTGYSYSKNGNLRYKVRDVNHGKKTDKLKGYITANKNYVVPVYYSGLPKSKEVTIINTKGINSYKSEKLTGKSIHYKKGKVLKVVKFKKYNLTTRYVLSNGYYITANKKLIISVK